jgi:hypothetical protein
MEKSQCVRLFTVLNDHEVRFILIGGMNYFLRYRPVSTQDIDIWIHSSAENSARCEAALDAIDGEWGRTDEDWGPTRLKPRGWLRRQTVYCTITNCGFVDIFCAVSGLASFEECFRRSETVAIAEGVQYSSLSAQDMIDCQLAIPEPFRKLDRIRHLQSLLDS